MCKALTLFSCNIGVFIAESKYSEYMIDLKELPMIQENINSLRERVSELNKLLNVQSKYKDTEYRRGLTHELDRALYKYYKALLSQMRSMEGNGDGI